VNLEFTMIKYLVSFSESWNHRMLGVGRDLCVSSSPTPMLKQGHLEQAFYFLWGKNTLLMGMYVVL